MPEFTLLLFTNFQNPIEDYCWRFQIDLILHIFSLFFILLAVLSNRNYKQVNIISYPTFTFVISIF